MKKNLLLVNGLIILILASCGGRPEGTRAVTGEARETSTGIEYTDAYSVDLTKSKVNWWGYKPGGVHNGFVKLQSGNLYLSGNEVVGGEFVMDMNSIVNEDIEDEGMNARLVNHLKSEDFFLVDSFPVSNFVITDIAPITGEVEPIDDNVTPNYVITGNLTMKDITRSVTFNAYVDVSDNKVKAKTERFLINRAEWNVRYMSKSFFDDLKDEFINDEIALKISLNANSGQ